jgi:4-hydroxy-3-methylbut-2-enyl diphosphate reductase
MEVARYAREGREVILIGHAGHPEVEGTMGQFDTAFGGRILLVERPEDVARLDVKDPSRLAFVTQTTLSVDDTLEVVEALRDRFTDIAGPRSDDICYATQNRQVAVKAIAPDVDVVLVVGALNSSNSNRLVEVARSMGTDAYLVPDESSLDPEWLAGATTVGVTSGASAPEVLVDRLLEKLASLGFSDVETREVTTEDVTFSLPPWLRPQGAATS